MYPFSINKAFFLAESKSDEIISEHISCAEICGSHPSIFFALEGSPSNVSTSVGRKYLLSIFTITSPIEIDGHLLPEISETTPK